MVLLPQQLSGMRLGCESSKLYSVPKGLLGAEPPINSWGRLLGVQRVKGQNDIYPDCVPTGYCNQIQLAKAESGDFSLIDDGVPLSIYKVFDPTLTKGMCPEDLYAWGMSTAVDGWKLKTWQRLDHTNEQDLRLTIKRLGSIGLIVELGLAQQNQIVWTPGTGDTPGSWGGHYVCADSCSGAISDGTSWGQPAYIDREYFQTPGYVVGAYALEFEFVA